MRIISRPRQGGKSTELMRWMDYTDDSTVIVSTYNEREFFLRHYDKVIGPKRQLDTRRVIVAKDVYEYSRGRREVPIAIDNLELVLISLLGTRVDLATTSEPVTLV